MERIVRLPAKLDSATAGLVFNFAEALGEKLFAAQEKHGFRDDWMSPDWIEECRENLRRHVEKGDPRDVAAYCAFLWFHDAKTNIAPTDHSSTGH